MSHQTPKRLSREEIETLAEEVLAESDISTPPIDPIRVSSRHGMKLYNAEFVEDSISGMLRRKGPNITVLIRASDSAFRKRFTIAHELGHIILDHFDEQHTHSDSDVDLFRTDLAHGGDQNEVQANMFASALLMPRSLVRAAYETEKNVKDLAKIFNVSEEAMGYRLSSLRLSA